MRIGIASDHAGRALKGLIIASIDGVIDYGVSEEGDVDYPDYAQLLSRDVSCGQLDFGIAVCGTGIGMAIVANKFKNVRAALVWSEDTCRLSREHNDANILCLGARVLNHEQAVAWTKTWLSTPFVGGKHERRLQKIAGIEGTIS